MEKIRLTFFFLEETKKVSKHERKRRSRSPGYQERDNLKQLVLPQYMLSEFDQYNNVSTFVSMFGKKHAAEACQILIDGFDGTQFKESKELEQKKKDFVNKVVAEVSKKFDFLETLFAGKLEWNKFPQRRSLSAREFFHADLQPELYKPLHVGLPPDVCSLIMLLRKKSELWKALPNDVFVMIVRMTIRTIAESVLSDYFARVELSTEEEVRKTEEYYKELAGARATGRIRRAGRGRRLPYGRGYGWGQPDPVNEWYEEPQRGAAQWGEEEDEEE